MANNMRLNLAALDAHVKEMEKLGLLDQGQKDWEDDACDPVEKSMVTKDKPVNNQPFKAPRGQGFTRGRFRGRARGKKNSNSFRGRGGYQGNNNGIRPLDTISLAGSDRSSSSYYSINSGFRRPNSRFGGYNSGFGSDSGFEPSNSPRNYDSDSMSDFSSVSQRQSSFSERLTAANLAKRLSEFDGFQATLLQLLDRCHIDHKQAEKVAKEYKQTFEVEAELLRLRPEVGICSSYLEDGCTDREKCRNIHLCSKYVFGICSERDCCFGHFWMTDHNKRVFHYFNINLLTIKQISGLFKNFILPKAKGKELKICNKYNENKCDDKNCSDLHLCLLYLAKMCTEKDCKLSHNVADESTSSVLQIHGLAMNESPRDILFNISNIPSVKAVIDSLKSDTLAADPGLDEVAPESMDKSEAKSSETMSDSKVDKKVAAEEAVPPKTTWSYELIGNVTIDEICYNSVEDFCLFEESGCWRLHCPLHFHWQIKATLGKKKTWVNLTEEQVFALEKAYCDPFVSKIDLPSLDPSKFKSSEKGLLLILKGKSKWEANFDSMELVLTGKKEVLDLRRLYTEDTRNETPATCIFNWYFSDKNKNWIEYGNTDSTGEENLKCDVTSKDIENHYKTRSKSPLSFKNQSFSYLLDLQNMVQTNLKTNVVRKVRRRPAPHIKEEKKKPKSDLPANWEEMHLEERSKRVTLAPSSDEYKTIINHFNTQAQGNNYNILKIERVQNPYLFRAFQNKVQQMKVTYKNDATIDIRQLFHGTGPDIVPKICEENFDWRLHGTSTGQAYGRGTYFSTSSKYSNDYARPDSNGHKYMFVAKVAVGTITTGNSQMSRPPTNQQYNIPYDSTVDNMSNTIIIVKYDKQEYFPEYIITLV